MKQNSTMWELSGVCLSVVCVVLLILASSAAFAGPTVSVPGSLSRSSLRNDNHLSGAQFNPHGNRSNFKFVSPEPGKTYNESVKVVLAVPPSLPGNPTLTLNIRCRPLTKGIVRRPKQLYNTTYITKPLYTNYYQNKVWSIINAIEIYTKIFRGINIPSPSQFQIEAIIRAGNNITMTTKSGWFRLVYNQRKYRKQKAMLEHCRPGIGFEGEGQRDDFIVPATVRIRVGRLWNTEVDYQIQGNNCQPGLRYEPLSIKPKISSKDEATAILAFYITKPGCYRVRARHKTSDGYGPWSSWRNFKVISKKHNRRFGLIPSFKPQPLKSKAINPQPEPPGGPAMFPNRK